MLPHLDHRRWFFRQSKLAIYLTRRLWSLRLVRIVGVALVLVAAVPFVVFFILRPHPQADVNYGVTFSNKYAAQLGLDWQTAYLKILDDLRVPRLRLTAYWDEIEAERDVYDFSIIRWQLDRARERNIPVILITGRKVVRYPECFEPQWWEEITSESEREREVYEFVEQTVMQLQEYPNITMWQIENEPFFPFGDCALDIKWSVLKKEIALARSLDSRPILTQDSGEGGLWLPTYTLGDYLAISMYRRIWFDFWGVLLGRTVYFQYPLSYWTYKIKADLVRVPFDRIIVTELQAEPWGPRGNEQLSRAEKDRTMSRQHFIDTLNYSQKAGFKDLYFWGAEWWLYEKEDLGESFYWDTARALFTKVAVKGASSRDPGL